jgi:hypothetical protein
MWLADNRVLLVDNAIEPATGPIEIRLFALVDGSNAEEPVGGGRETGASN